MKIRANTNNKFTLTYDDIGVTKFIMANAYEQIQLIKKRTVVCSKKANIKVGWVLNYLYKQITLHESTYWFEKELYQQDRVLTKKYQQLDKLLVALDELIISKSMVKITLEDIVPILKSLDIKV